MRFQSLMRDCFPSVDRYLPGGQMALSTMASFHAAETVLLERLNLVVGEMCRDVVDENSH